MQALSAGVDVAVTEMATAVREWDVRCNHAGIPALTSVLRTSEVWYETEKPGMSSDSVRVVFGKEQRKNGASNDGDLQRV